ncbi:nascent polypeptide-associated complex subunit alpha, muscle-specific form-like isoform X1 [Gadus morhua]|uniref:nascent polypeptide-associated complex subunit alpha, muscle-specific form-like isoform X1 n=1 Tax=Gadus morhua TaxID=8049 RepID=UPI0011B7ECF7|nr:nascent polypeptide-associated complex subunit alpha, muscle-specific form-like isoform X1 [Gadus morhua]
MLKYIMLINSGEKILPGSKRLESLLGTGNPDLLDFIQRRLHLDSTKSMTPGQALKHASMKKTSLGCMSLSPGNPPKTVMLKTLAATTTQHLKPDEATGSQPQTMDQGEMAKLGKHGRILRPLTSELNPLLPPIGAPGPAPPPRGKRSTAITDVGAVKRDAGATRPARQAQCSLLPPFGATPPAPPPRGKRSTASTDGGVAKSVAVTTRPACRAQYPLLPPIGAAGPAPPPSCKRATVTKDGGAAKRVAGTSRPAGQTGCSRIPPIRATAPAAPPRGKRTTVATHGLADRCISSQMHLKPVKGTGSQSKTMDQGATAKLRKHGRTLRPLTLETYSKVLPIGAASPAAPSRGQRAIATTDGGAAMSDEGKSRPADRRYSPLSHPLVQLPQLLSQEARGQLLPQMVVQPRGTQRHPDLLAKRDAPKSVPLTTLPRLLHQEARRAC